MWWPAQSIPISVDATMSRIMWNLFFMITMQWIPLVVYAFLSLFVWGLLFQTIANIFQNLTTNERMNSDRYSHFRDSTGKYVNRCTSFASNFFADFAYFAQRRFADLIEGA
jgi:hypothetical protein